MAEEAGSPFFDFYRPKMRGQLSIEKLHIPKRLKKTVRQAPYKVTIGQTVNTLRLWEVEVPEWVSHKVESQKKVDFNSLSDAQKQRLEVLRIVHGLNDNLYPDDTFEEGKNLRLAQEYVLSSASLQNIIARHLRKHSTLDNLSDSTAVQIDLVFNMGACHSKSQRKAKEKWGAIAVPVPTLDRRSMEVRDYD